MLKFFTPFDDAKARIAAKKKEIADQERNLEQDEYLARQRDGLNFRLEASKADCATKKSTLDKAVQDFSDADFAKHFLNGCNGTNTDFALIENLAMHAVAIAELKRRLPGIKSALAKLIIDPAKKALADFEKENKVALSKIPAPKKVAEIPFAPPEPVDAFAREPNIPSPGVRLMMNLRPGERANAGYEAKTDGKILTEINDD